MLENLSSAAVVFGALRVNGNIKESLNTRIIRFLTQTSAIVVVV